MSLASELIQKVKLGVSQLQPAVKGTAEEVSEFVRKHPVTSAVTVGGGVLAGTTIIQVLRKKKAKAKTKAKKKTTKPRRKRSKLSWQLDRARISKQKHEVAYQRRKKAKSTRKTKKKVGKIYYTKRGQPYKILASGKARFIKLNKRSRR